MLASDVLTDTRNMLSDAGSTRWTDAVLLRYLNDAVIRVSEMRPDLLLTAADTVQTLSTIDAAGDTLPYGDALRQSLIWLTAAMALKEDSDDRANMERAERYEGYAIARLQGES